VKVVERRRKTRKSPINWVQVVAAACSVARALAVLIELVINHSM